MAQHLLASLPAAAFPCSILTRLQPTSRTSVVSLSNGFSPSRVQCVAATKISHGEIDRRSANYQPSLWGYDYIQSLGNEYVGESYVKQFEKLKREVRVTLNKAVDVDYVHQLELIDTLQRLGVSYHFEEEIKCILNAIYNISSSSYHILDKKKQESLYAVALEFRLLRQHGFDVPTETFSSFMDEKGNFMSSLSDDCSGILAMYEAAHLLVEEEKNIFYEAVNFTSTILKEYVKNKNDHEYLSTLVNHALELPLHWRMPRFEARWFIDAYEKGPNMNPVLLELAKLDFNFVQATHQEDLKYASRWWRKTGLGEKLNFARDRLMENFCWSAGEKFEPQFGYFRRMLTIVNTLITTIDDVYDVYGTLEELELFTDAVHRWDAAAAETLPYYMKLCFHTLHNSINEMSFDALREQGVDIISYLKKAWEDICESYLLEAKWYNSGYIPTLQEYMDNAWISIGATVILTHAYVLTANPITKEALECVQEYPDIIRWSSMILRLADDLGTSSDELKRGDVHKSIQCYMHETGVSENDAREHIRDLIAKIWMKMNKDRFVNPHIVSNKVFVGIAMNLPRMAQFIYLYGDGHAVPDHSKDRLLSLFVNPIPILNHSEILTVADV